MRKKFIPEPDTVEALLAASKTPNDDDDGGANARQISSFSTPPQLSRKVTSVLAADSPNTVVATLPQLSLLLLFSDLKAVEYSLRHCNGMWVLLI